MQRLELTPPKGLGLSDPEIPFNSSISQSPMVPCAQIPRHGCVYDATAFLGVARVGAYSLQLNMGVAGSRHGCCRVPVHFPWSEAQRAHPPSPSPATSEECAPSALSAAAKPGSMMSPDVKAAARAAVTSDPHFLLSWCLENRSEVFPEGANEG